MPQYPTIGLALDIGNWEKLNNTIFKIGQDIDNVAQVALDEVIDQARLNYLSPVENFAAIQITYPTPNTGDAVQTSDDGKVYRYNGQAWVVIQEFGMGPITAVQNEVNTYTDQTDFVAMVERNTEYDKMMYKRENSLNYMTVMLMRGSEHVSWTFRNNTYDDYWILGDCFAGTVSLGLAIYQNKNYDTKTGTWVTTAPNAHYATNVGATMTTTVTGESIEFHYYADNRGGIWEFVIDGDTANKVTVSTWKSTATSTNNVTLKSGLAFGTHTVVGTFKGDDPANAPSSGAGTSRGWIYVDGLNGYLTFRTYKTQLTNSRDKDLFINFSNKEFALKMRKANFGTAQFVPMHSNIGTAFNAEQRRILANGSSVDPASLIIGEFIECDDFKLVQKVYARNPDSLDENLATIATTVSINKKGTAEINGKMQVLSTIQVEEGYFLMAPVSKLSINRLATSINNYYDATKTDGSRTYLSPEKDRATSYAFTSSSSKDFIIAARFNDYRNSLRTGGEGKYTENFNTWIEHRDATMTKLYASVFHNATLNPGEVFRWSGSLTAAKLANIHELI